MEELINGIGAMAEMAGIMRDQLLANGFTREEAYDIAKDLLIQSFISSLGAKGEGEK